MNFSLGVWYKYRKQARILSDHINSYRDKKTKLINLEKEALAGYVAHITCILLECAHYMDKTGLTLPPALWKYVNDDPTTHPSSVAFKYKDLMTAKQIKAYGEGFMNDPLPKKKKAA
jgi:hypothetical protein